MMRITGIVFVLVVAGCARGADPRITGGPIRPAAVWVDPTFGDSTHFLLAGAREWTETAVLWFDVQLLDSAGAYSVAAERLSERPRHETRQRVIGRLRALNDSSWAIARAVVDSLVASGAILGCEPMWIVNGATCALDRNADAAVLAQVPGVRRVYRGMPDRVFPVPDSVGPRFVDDVVEAGYAPAVEDVPWNLRRLGVPELWTAGLTGRGVRVVVHDGGFALDAEPVRHNLWRNPGELPGNGVDDDGNGYIDDVHGFQFDARNAELNRAAVVGGQLVHGTAVAALAVGRSTTDTGVTLGIAPGATWAAVMAVRNFHEALQWALLNDFDVYGMSFSYPALGETRSHFRKMLEHAALAGLFLVSGAGNFGDPDSPAYVPLPVQLRTPEDVPLAVFGVSGVDSTGIVPAFSSRGPVEWRTLDYPDGIVAKPDLATVNSDIVVPDMHGAGATRSFRGNSFAAPHLVGILALLLEADPDVSPWEMRRILIETARDIGPAGPDSDSGAGIVDAAAALWRLRER